ncbi:MAG: RidA family protein [Chloroflexia bacterium]|nr:RidA family protein [Chloroflexia bacterium]
MAKREIIQPAGTTPNPILSPVAKFGNIVFTAGMVGTDPATGKMAGDTIEAQGRQTMENLKVALEAAGTSLDNALKVTGFVSKLEYRTPFNEIYKEYFTGAPPVRTCIEGFLGDGVLVEVDVVACIPE